MIIGTLAFGMVACGGNETKETEAVAEEVAVEEVAVEATNLMVDTENSSVNWKGEMVGGAYFHTGTINITEGNVSVAGDAVTGGSFTIDMTNLTTTDSSYSEEHSSEMLIGHLASPDFFDVENNPTANFVIKSVEGNVVTGDLTVRGTTVEETVENVTVSTEGGVTTATGTLTFDRQKVGVAYESTMEDMVISDDIALEITLKANAAN